MKESDYSIVLIVPYFGKFPSFFPLWLSSCKYNPTINWIIYTDCKDSYDYPANIEVVYCTFLDVVKRVQSHFDFKIELNNPYKLCDFKPSYGEVFKEDIQEFDFWGYCDIDLVFGNIRKFINKSILSNYERVQAHGHFSLFKNNEKINAIYRSSIAEDLPYKRIFTNSKHFGFDEHGKNHLYDIFVLSQSTIYLNNTLFADIDSFLRHFVSTYTRKLVKPLEIDELKENENWKGKATIFSFEKGVLNRLQVNNDQLNTKEYMYVHLQKRAMAKDENLDDTKFLIIPNKFISYTGPITKESVVKFGKAKFWYHKRIKRQLYSRSRMLIYKYLKV